MCGKNPFRIDLKTNEELCNGCASINESIYLSKGKRGNYKEI